MADLIGRHFVCPARLARPPLSARPLRLSSIPACHARHKWARGRQDRQEGGPERAKGIFLKMYYTYVLLSENDRDFYIGFTEDLKKRFNQHKQGLVSSTAHRRPLKLIYYEACLNKYDGIKREKYFKSGFGRRFLKNRLQTFLEEELATQARDGGRG